MKTIGGINYLDRQEAMTFLERRGVSPLTFQGLYFVGMRYGVSKKIDGHIYFSKKVLKEYAATKSRECPPGWMTIAQAADFYKVSRVSVYKAVERGQLPCRSIGAGEGIKVVNTNGINTISKKCTTKRGK